MWSSVLAIGVRLWTRSRAAAFGFVIGVAIVASFDSEFLDKVEEICNGAEMVL